MIHILKKHQDIQFPVKWIFLCVLAIHACKPMEEESAPALLSASSYVKLDTGFYREYKVEIKRYSTAGNSIPDSTDFLLRYEHKEFTTLQDGVRAIKIERFKRNTTEDNWIFDSTFLLWHEPKGVIESRSNRINLLLPSSFKVGTTWDFNQLNSLGSVTAEILNAESSLNNFKNLLYAQIEKKPINFVSSRNQYKLYAEGIGEVLNYNETLVYFQGDRFGLYVPESGEVYREELTSHGIFP